MYLKQIIAGFGVFQILAFTTAKADELKVAAASDLTKAFTEIGAAFEKQNGNKVVFTFGASGLLTKQIENGAPYDVFAAANTSYLKEIETKDLVEKSDIKVYAEGHIGLFVRKGAPAPPKSLSEITKYKFEHLAIANPKVAPYGKAAQEALESAGVWKQVEPKLVLGENIQQTLQFAQTGNADIAIVSMSLGKSGDGQFVSIPDKLHKPILQAMGALKGSRKIVLARQFMMFVTGKVGSAILKKHGFTVGVKPEPL